MFPFANLAQVIALASLGFSFSSAHPTPGGSELSKRFDDVPIYKSQGLGTACGGPIGPEIINASMPLFQSRRLVAENPIYGHLKQLFALSPQCQDPGCVGGAISLNPFLFEQLVGSTDVDVVYGSWDFNN
ncbi:hypothetical protein PHLCEN_2v5804 [Hermanssonia centrifuga]|uniref:Uncharacterized protein n=1 Tax=Hermanssonia centrifuga TaxID=98765 RepID=A0A2R6P187_9APHY|nr:hypothetical protein PHLCEN_2v5804 [Hermanssonia centrifuga]